MAPDRFLCQSCHCIFRIGDRSPIEAAAWHASYCTRITSLAKAFPEIDAELDAWYAPLARFYEDAS